MVVGLCCWFFKNVVSQTGFWRPCQHQITVFLLDVYDPKPKQFCDASKWMFEKTPVSLLCGFFDNQFTLWNQNWKCICLPNPGEIGKN
jgi:hypothetical protein